MTDGLVYVAGAGLAGLAAALTLADAGHRVTMLEAGPAAGGRCRSYEDRELGCRIDNGNHLLLSGNTAAFAYLKRLGTAATLGGPGRPLFPFHDLATGEHWLLRPSAGRLPWWIFQPGRRVPGTGLGEYIDLRHWLRPRPGATVAEVARHGPLYRRLIEPLAIAALNTMPEQGSAALMASVMRQTLLQGGAACIPSFPRVGLSESFVDPAIAAIAARGGSVQFGRRVSALETENGRVTAIATPDGPIPLAAEDRLVLAVPAPVAAALLPALDVPDAFEAIINLHYRIDLDPGPAGFAGIVGGRAEWVFFKPGITSVTISAANRYADLAAAEVAASVWTELGRIRTLPPDMPPWRLVREKRATFAATVAQSRRRPSPRAAGLANLVLAGDWTDTGLPATIEAAIRSGNTAAACITEASRASPG